MLAGSMLKLISWLAASICCWPPSVLVSEGNSSPLIYWPRGKDRTNPSGSAMTLTVASQALLARASTGRLKRRASASMRAGGKLLEDRQGNGTGRAVQRLGEGLILFGDGFGGEVDIEGQLFGSGIKAFADDVGIDGAIPWPYADGGQALVVDLQKRDPARCLPGLHGHALFANAVVQTNKPAALMRQSAAEKDDQQCSDAKEGDPLHLKPEFPEEPLSVTLEKKG